MKDKNLIALAAMFLLTLTGASLSALSKPAFFILLLFGLKFMLVATYFMELRHTHPIWRFALGLLLCMIFGAVLVAGG